MPDAITEGMRVRIRTTQVEHEELPDVRGRVLSVDGDSAVVLVDGYECSNTFLLTRLIPIPDEALGEVEVSVKSGTSSYQIPAGTLKAGESRTYLIPAGMGGMRNHGALITIDVSSITIAPKVDNALDLRIESHGGTRRLRRIIAPSKPSGGHYSIVAEQFIDRADYE